MRYSKNKLIDSVVRRLLKGDWRVKACNRHVKLENKITRAVLVVPGSPSDHRSAQNWLHQAKNSYGIEVTA